MCLVVSWRDLWARVFPCMLTGRADPTLMLLGVDNKPKVTAARPVLFDASCPSYSGDLQAAQGAF